MVLTVKDMSFKEGLEFKIRIKIKDDCDNFSINIGHDNDNFALHFNPRFDHGGDSNIIVCNSLSGGSWGDEHRDNQFPFSRGDECKLYINFNYERFYIKLPDGQMIDFPNRLGDVKYKFFEVCGGAKVIGFSMK